MRTEPSENATAIPCISNDGQPLRLADGTVVWLLDEAPVEAEGYSWYHVVVNATYPTGAPSGHAPCHEVPTLVGWVAGGAGDDPWLGPIICPDLGDTDLEQLSGLAGDPLRTLACVRGDPISVVGYYEPIPEGIGFSCPGIEPTWLTCSLHVLSSGADVAAFVRVPPTVVMPARGQSVVVTGHFDDPAALTCLPPDPAYISETQAIFYCRTQFVVDTAQPAS